MPSFASDGTTIVICSGVTGELEEIQIDENHKDVTSSKCPYSMTGVYNDVSVPVLVKLKTSYIRISRRIDDVFVAQTILLSNQTRGPPAISLT